MTIGFDIRRLGHDQVAEVQTFMNDILSRLANPSHYASDDEAYLHALVAGRGEMYGAYHEHKLAAFSAVVFPGVGIDNLGREFGVPEQELLRVAALDGTVVHESARGHGLQRFFHQLREERAHHYGCLHLYSTVHPDNLASLRNLEACGFERQFTRLMYGNKNRHCYAKRLET